MKHIVNKQKKEIKNQQKIYSNCLYFINECKKIIKRCSSNYKNSFRCNLKHFKNNKELIEYRDRMINRQNYYKSVLEINEINKKKYDELLTCMYNNLVYYEILLNK